MTSSPEPCGVVVIDKPAGMTSFDVVAKLRRIYGTRRIGHTGTLDPEATGVLVMLIGRAAKAAEYINTDVKAYAAVLRLGLETTTEDITGEVTARSPSLPSYEAAAAAAASFAGEYMQTPPMYSALKRDGKKLVDLARRGIVVEREPRRVVIHNIELTRDIPPLGVTPEPGTSDHGLYVRCSAGTYIRTLCADIGAALGCGGCMAALRRTEACGFTLGDASALAEAEASPERALLPLDTLFSSLPKLPLEGEALRRVKNGLGTRADISSPRVRLYDGDSFFGLGELTQTGEYKCVKFFVL